ncbi:hypothetical protein XENOCAPTIV_016774 [Xenoophorus captivus]|uniref:Uncharacterized protein n=1 Tax=Xenoophorus captivus TaxID=1517983 RepID=A0ABV0RC95_9TELE
MAYARVGEYKKMQQVQLYFMILERLGKCDEALEVIRGPLGGDEDMVWQGLGLLEEGLSHSSSNAQFKLLLLLLYCRLGAFEPVVDLYSSLDAKHIQHDTIGSTSEYIIQAYKYGAFEKIPEFIALRNRLNQSLHFAQVRTERMLLDLFLEADMQLTDEHRIRSLEEESMWLQIRSLTLRLLASLTASGHAPSQQNSEISNENGVGDKSSLLRSLLSQLNQTLQTAVQIEEKHVQVQDGQALIHANLPVKYPLLGPPSTRLASALSIGSCQCQAAALQLSVHLQELESAGLGERK